MRVSAILARLGFAALLLACASALGCGASSRELGSDTRASIGSRDEEALGIRRVLDAWHEAAARSDEVAYFELMTSDAVFLGTDATERWSRDAFRAYAHRPFSEGRGWHMRAARRDVVIGPGPIRVGAIAWFDEDLETVNLGPARGSGVLVRDELGWRIAQYNLAITVPNERFDAVRALLGPASAEAPSSSVGADADDAAAHEAAR
ncbi:MAG: nuclear transport factor 2 family protein [Sandaracinaceae bacterium]|nr:nuclear transport factor 2 family protein [Sandaracinaceae bacterium]